MITIDALGQPCPIPVVRAKQAIAGLGAQGGVVAVLVDNEIACQNLAKMAGGLGHAHRAQARADGSYCFVITVGSGGAAQEDMPPEAPAPAPAPAQGGLVVAVGADSMGRGSEELGSILIKGFLFSLAQLEEPPGAVLFFNSGVRLTLPHASTLSDLRALAGRGTALLVCGTCADYYGCKEQIAVGEIVNMYDIVQTMSAAGRLLSV